MALQYDLRKNGKTYIKVAITLFNLCCMPKMASKLLQLNSPKILSGF